MGIEPIGLLTRRLIDGLYQVWGKHRVPLAIDKPRKDGAFIAPLAEIFDGSGPHADVATAILGVVGVVRTDDIGTELPRLVRVLKHTGFAVGQVFPQREIRVLR